MDLSASPLYRHLATKEAAGEAQSVLLEPLLDQVEADPDCAFLGRCRSMGRWWRSTGAPQMGHELAGHAGRRMRLSGSAGARTRRAAVLHSLRTVREKKSGRTKVLPLSCLSRTGHRRS
ncbi:MAG: hypothetical protein ACLTYN_18130 [Dysosmobacter welbionis]